MYRVQVFDGLKKRVCNSLMDCNLRDAKEIISESLPDFIDAGEVVFTPLQQEVSRSLSVYVKHGKFLPKVSTHWVTKTKVPSESQDTEYIVTEYDDGHYECTCPHFEYRCIPGIDTCKHTGVE